MSVLVQRSNGGAVMNGITMDPPGAELSPSGDSPLQLFVQAKKKINEIYIDIEAYVREAHGFLGGAPDVLVPVRDDGLKDLDDCRRKVSGIREVLQRDHMKVVFFGRTSNGKSTAINALLGNKILPTGIGHTTSCFLQVEGGSEDEAFILTEDSEERKSMESISHLAHALCSQSHDPNTLVRIIWPKERCKMLDQEVVIIDSPGIDVETDLDEWIDKYCLDSDVFVLVANAESTLMLSEKKFFHKVSERLSSPNIFIIHNRSDAFSGEEMHNEVKQQHCERALKFLMEELGVVSSRAEAEDRIFFVSAKEALQARMQEAKGLPPQISTEDFFPRYLEFQNFEKKFAHCLSHSAVKTKFASHTQRGLCLVRSISQLMATVHNDAVKHQLVQLNLKKELQSKCEHIKQQLEVITAEMKAKIASFTEDIEYKVGKAMSEEIRRLSALVDDFNEPFHPDPLVLNVYKSKINSYIEKGVGSNLKSRLSSDMELNMDAHRQDMIARMAALLPLEQQQISLNIMPRRETFEVLYHINCENLCSDFQEDIRFRFSLAIMSLLNRYLSPSKVQSIPRGFIGDSPMTPPTRNNASSILVPQDDWSFVSKLAIASVSSHGTMGGLLLGGMLLKTVGWKAIIASTALYGAVYAYERMTWTTTAKCKEFKKQYVEHAARKFRLIVDMTSANCSHQVQQELSSTFARLCHLVDETTVEMAEDIQNSEKILNELNETGNRSKVLRNQANFINSKLELFQQSYLSLEESNSDH